MSEKLPSKYQVGDAVWHARCSWLPVEKSCPICYGNREVKLTLGNGDEMILPCNFCTRGFEPPTGTVKEYEYVVDPEPVAITGIELRVNGGSIQAHYRSGPFGYDEERLFESKEAAALKGQELKAELEEDQRTKAEYLKKDKAKSFSWNAGYHLRAAKQDRKSAEHHEKLARLCKERAKEK